MCGIAGIFHCGTIKPVDPARVERMSNALAHRGPDGSGVWTAPGVGLGHRRLSIIDIAGSPLLWFTGYWHQDTPAIAGGYYRTGDNVELEPDGSISFIGRADDVITSSGYRIGPGEIEDCLIRHPAVALAAAIGKPDAMRTEIVKAFIVLKEGFAPSEGLAGEIQSFVRARLSAHEYPREIAFRSNLPLTTTGKVIRRLLRQEA